MKKPYLVLWFSCILFGIALSTKHDWTCDDAFISIRYAANLADGRGLVFNEGERVEGYTNFLWTLMTTGAMSLGVDPVTFTSVAGVVSFILLIFVLTVLPRRSMPDPFLPYAPAFFALLYHVQIYATSGLETMFFTLLSTTGFLLTAMPSEKDGDTSRRRSIFGFLLLGLAVLTRPDGIVFYIMAAVFHAWNFSRGGESVDRLTRIPAGRISELLSIHALPAVFLTVFAVWKIYYYGDLLPNTFYAKSADRAFFSQGSKYVGLFFASYWMIVAPLVAYVVWRKMFRKENEERENAKLIPLIGMAGVWIFYVAWVGGDFMFARFLIPIVPILLIAVDLTISRMIKSGKRAASFHIPVLLIWGAVQFLRYDPYRGAPMPIVHGISEEHKIYTPERMAFARTLGRELAPIMRTSGARIAFVGAQAGLIYYMAPGFAIEAETGLTDKLIARQPLESRGRIGHEKTASLEYLQSRRIHFLLRPTMDQGVRAVEIEGLTGRFPILTYDKKVFSELAKSRLFKIHGQAP